MILQRHLSIRRILALVSLLFLLLPVGGIYFLRIYESALLRQTESELISQGAFVAAIYQHEIADRLTQQHLPVSRYGLPLAHAQRQKSNALSPIFPQLDLAKDPIHAARPQPEYTRDTLDPVASLAGTQIMPVLQEAQRVTLSGIKVLDYQGLVVAGAHEKGLSFAQVEEFQASRQGKPVSFLRARRMSDTSAALGSTSRNANINVFVALPITLQNRLIGVVWLNRTPMDLPQALFWKRYELGWTVLSLVVIAILIARLTSLSITRPIRALVEKTRLITQGDPQGQEPLHAPITREVAELSDNIAQMARTLQQRSAYIQNFTAHISHEFKTPLTAIQGSVELLQDNLAEMPPAQQQHFLNNIAQDTDRLGRLVSRLLELTRVDLMEKIDRSAQTADLRGVLHELVASQKDQSHANPVQDDLWPEGAGPAQDFQIQVHFEAPALGEQEAFRAAIAPDSLHAVLAHLIENSKQAGAQTMTLTVTPQANGVWLDVQDDGPGITPANQNAVFTPFFTTKRQQGGTGLGLSITQALLERYHGKITLLDSTTGAHFRLMLLSG